VNPFNPSGERARVTNDLNSYNGVSVSADGHSIATAQTEITAGIDVGSLQGGDWTRLTAGTRRGDGIGGMTWVCSRSPGCGGVAARHAHLGTICRGRKILHLPGPE